MADSAPSAVARATPIWPIKTMDDSLATGVDLKVTHGHSLKIPSAQLLANDIDPNQAPLTLLISSFTQPAHGTLTRDTDAGLIYRAPVDYVGDDTFTYKATDQYHAISNAATVALSVTNVPPRAQSMILDVSGSLGLTGTMAGGASDADADSLTYSSSLCRTICRTGARYRSRSTANRFRELE
jgi:hypothetical protein